MKTLQTLLVILLLTITANSFAQTKGIKKDTIKVWGNCEMCKSTIEKAAKKAGASYANWNTESKILVVKYAGATGNEKIQKEVAASGYDTELFTAPDAAYNKLHGCCKYDRKEAGTQTQKQ